MHIFYVDVPYDYKYNFKRWGVEYGDEVLSRDFNTKIEFICNSGAKISHGDCHRIIVDTEKDELFFLITSGFEKIPTEIVEKYIADKYPMNFGASLCSAKAMW